MCANFYSEQQKNGQNHLFLWIKPIFTLKHAMCTENKSEMSNSDNNKKNGTVEKQYWLWFALVCSALPPNLMTYAVQPICVPLTHIHARFV